MSSSEIHVIAILTPTPGKETRVKELLSGLAANVEKLESGVVRLVPSPFPFFETHP